MMILETTGTLATTLATLNPLRYRGYVYDQETQLYYLQSRYYNPQIGRFLNADNYPSTGQGLSGNNMFAYCGNNPVSRKDEGGNWWLLSIGIGIATQYASDVIGNLLAGKTGADIFIPTSSVGEYIAAGVTALIPGSGFGGALVRNVITETIIVTEEVIVGNEVNVLRSIGNVALGSVLDTTFETITDKALDFVDSKAPTNYSSYAHNVRQNNPSMSRKDVLVSMQRSIRINRILSETVSYLMDLGRSLLPW